MTRGQLSTSIVERFLKPVMGRLDSPAALERVTVELAPIIDRASKLPEVEPALEAIAKARKCSVEEARLLWVRLEEADILLESGGNQDDISSAGAVGVAQWIYETGKRAGLKIDKTESDRLTRQLEELKRKSLEERPFRSEIEVSRTAVVRQNLQPEIDKLRAARCRIDERFDPEPALAAHARYLLGIYRKFPSLEWVFQAFHGGEAGVRRTLKSFLGARWPGSPAAAIAMKGTTFEDVYFGSTPRSHPDAFSYLYARLDDHRFYWWKLLAARHAISLFRRNRAEFMRQWESLLPGRAKESVWYPDFDTERGMMAASLPLSPKLWTLSPGADSRMRPESIGLLKLLTEQFRKEGGKLPLKLGDLYHAQPLPAAATGPLPGGGPPRDSDYHATGMAFDLLRPENSRERKILEYALTYLADRQILWYRDVQDRGPRHFHAIPNPLYRPAFVNIATTGKPPDTR